jgi:hypothetical protein
VAAIKLIRYPPIVLTTTTTMLQVAHALDPRTLAGALLPLEQPPMLYPVVLMALPVVNARDPSMQAGVPALAIHYPPVIIVSVINALDQPTRVLGAPTFGVGADAPKILQMLDDPSVRTRARLLFRRQRRRHPAAATQRCWTHPPPLLVEELIGVGWRTMLLDRFTVVPA